MHYLDAMDYKKELNSSKQATEVPNSKTVHKSP
jgi:hypothetical protein